MDFLQELKKRVLLFDGGFGSMLLASGKGPFACPEEANLTCPEAVEAIHRAYFDAGSDIVETNSLGANAFVLKNHGLEDKVCEIAQNAVQLARKAARETGMVAYSVGPTGKLLSPMGDLTPRAAFAAYKECIAAGSEADCIYIETMSDLAEARLALLAAKDVCKKPVVVSFTYQNGHLLTGAGPEAAAATLTACGVDAMATNCSGGPDELLAIVERYKEATHLPIIVQPNAGLPLLENGKTVYPLGAAEMAEKMVAAPGLGAHAIGGCCGTTPAHIAALSPIAKAAPAPATREKAAPALVTARRIVSLEEALEKPMAIPCDEDEFYDAPDEATMIRLNVDSLSLDEIEQLMQVGS